MTVGSFPLESMAPNSLLFAYHSFYLTTGSFILMIKIIPFRVRIFLHSQRRTVHSNELQLPERLFPVRTTKAIPHSLIVRPNTMDYGLFVVVVFFTLQRNLLGFVIDCWRLCRVWCSCDQQGLTGSGFRPTHHLQAQPWHRMFSSWRVVAFTREVLNLQ